MLEAAFLDPALPFESVDSGTIVSSGPFRYRLAGIHVDPATRRLSTSQRKGPPISVARNLVSLGLTAPPPGTPIRSGTFLGFRLLARYRALIYEAMKVNPFMLQLPAGLSSEAESRAVSQEILLRCAVADACTFALRSSPPGAYRDILANIQLSADQHARTLPVHTIRTGESKPVMAIGSMLNTAAETGPESFAAILLPLMAGENVRGAAVTNEPCIYDLFRHTPDEVIQALKDPNASPFRIDPRGPAEMIAELGPYTVDEADVLEAGITRVVREIDAMYRSCLTEA